MGCACNLESCDVRRVLDNDFILLSVSSLETDADNLLKRMPRASGESHRFTQVLLASETWR